MTNGGRLSWRIFSFFCVGFEVASERDDDESRG